MIRRVVNFRATQLRFGAERCIFEGCGSSAVWCEGAGAVAEVSEGSADRCGGYGTFYASRGGVLRLARVRQQRNLHGYGMMTLHEGSRIEAKGCAFNENLWAGVASRWSGSAHVEACDVCDNGGPGFQVRLRSLGISYQICHPSEHSKEKSV